MKTYPFRMLYPILMIAMLAIAPVANAQEPTPDQYFSVFPEWEYIEAWNWPLDTLVTATVDHPDPETPVCVAEAYSSHPDWDPNAIVAEFHLWETCDIQPGDFITVSGSLIDKDHTVTDLAVTGIDPGSDVVDGTASPDFDVNIWVHGVDSSYMTTTPDAGGNWAVNFADIGFDIVFDTGGRAEQPDGDGDRTALDWYLPFPPTPRFTVFPEQEVVEGWEWAMGETVQLSINSGELETTGVVEPAPWDPDIPWLWIDFSADFDVKAGDVVALSGPSGTAVHTVKFLMITEIDPTGNIVGGSADPGEEVRLWPYFWEETLFTQADNDGYWAADLDDIGFDLKYDTTVRALIVDDSNNETAVDFSPTPPIDGGHDGAEGVVGKSECAAFGWASDFDDPERVIDIQIISNGIPIASTQTESNEYYVDLWNIIDPMKVHEVSVQAYDVESDAWFDLSGTPRQIFCTGLPQGGNVSIVVETHFNTEEDSPFTASGAAVDEGLICPSGLVTDNEAHFSGPPDGSILNAQVEKLFTCEDGSGTFTLQLQVHVEFDPYKDRASWRVVGGTDDYTGLKGNGKLAGVPAEYGVIDYYGGMLSSK